MVDILKLRKNVCLCRHFQSLNKESLFSLDRASIFGTKTPKKLYIDVWLVDFFSPSYTNVSDTSSLFILQLACIVNMVPRWKKMKIRVFLAARDCCNQISNKDNIYSNQEESVPSIEAEDSGYRYVQFLKMNVKPLVETESTFDFEGAKSILYANSIFLKSHTSFQRGTGNLCRSKGCEVVSLQISRC